MTLVSFLLIFPVIFFCSHFCIDILYIYLQPVQSLRSFIFPPLYNSSIILLILSLWKLSKQSVSDFCMLHFCTLAVECFLTSNACKAIFFKYKTYSGCFYLIYTTFKIFIIIRYYLKSYCM